MLFPLLLGWNIRADFFGSFSIIGILTFRKLTGSLKYSNNLNLITYLEVKAFLSFQVQPEWKPVAQMGMWPLWCQSGLKEKRQRPPLMKAGSGSLWLLRRSVKVLLLEKLLCRWSKLPMFGVFRGKKLPQKTFNCISHDMDWPFILPSSSSETNGGLWLLPASLLVWIFSSFRLLPSLCPQRVTRNNWALLQVGQGIIGSCQCSLVLLLHSLFKVTASCLDTRLAPDTSDFLGNSPTLLSQSLWVGGDYSEQTDISKGFFSNLQLPSLSLSNVLWSGDEE